MENNADMTTQELTDKLGITERAVLRNLSKIKGKIIHVGPSNGGHWEIV